MYFYLCFVGLSSPGISCSDRQGCCPEMMADKVLGYGCLSAVYPTTGTHGKESQDRPITLVHSWWQEGLFAVYLQFGGKLGAC